MSEWGQPIGPLTAKEAASLAELGITLAEEPVPIGEGTWMVWRSQDGGYLGSEGVSEGYMRGLILWGIWPERATPGHRVASVGKGKDGRWYGWSHRACTAFAIGDGLYTEAEQVGRDDVPWTQIGQTPIETPAQQRQAAVNFAGSVS